ncbi:hypothetical protein WICMUC_000286 [Wickerhamomyces mucosus]|uniref:Cyclin N-terminal domain-containing protein n=1 Tax=Wickerhamomyces mucosus TaxID=1378264 RepID=A0A9P8PY69_9ASCO|nr:hypothetical protein WICMUC_000286 [Wickerhamomyces mucosus]
MASVYNYQQPYQMVDNNHHYSSAYPSHYTNYQPAAPMAPFSAVQQQQQQQQAPMGYGYNDYYQPVQQQQQQQQLPVQEHHQQEEVPGGVSSVLDYDLDIMSKFTTYLAFRLFGRNDTDNFKFILSIKSVLSAVRLPLNSLILSNYFLLEKYEIQSDYFIDELNTKNLELIYQNVVISLVLANKANDDNTFTNKSWSNATGLSIKLINSMEVDWLRMVGWQLHNTKMERFNELLVQFEKYSINVKTFEQQKQQQQQQQQQQQSEFVNSSTRSLSSKSSSSSLGSNSSPSYYHNNYDQSSSYYKPVVESKPIGLGNGYSRKNYYNSHRKAYSIDQNQYYQAQQYSYNQNNNNTNNKYNNNVHANYCLKTGSFHKSAYCSCDYCNINTNGLGYSNHYGVYGVGYNHHNTGWGNYLTTAAY